MTSPTILAFSFVTPSFALAGLLLVALPILIHLLNRRRYDTVSWAAMELLLRAMQQNRRRIRFENWLLLAMRCLILLLLGTALARPMGCDNQTAAALGGRSGLHVLVIDNSYSMAYQAGRSGGKTHLDQAKSVAAKLIDGLSPNGESVAIITAAKPAASLLTKPTYDLQQARAILDRIPQSYAAADLAGALRLSIDLGHEQSKESNKHLYLLTDGTASAWQGTDSAALKSQGLELAGLYRISHSNLSLGPQWNQAVLDVKPSTNLITTSSRFGADFIATIEGFGQPHDGSLQWKVDGKIVEGGGKVQPGIDSPPQIESQTSLHDAISSAGPHAVTATLINEDGLQADNGRTRIINVVSKLKTLIVEGQHGAGLNLKVALSALSKAGISDGFAAPDVISDLELNSHVLADYQAVVLCGLNQFTPVEADQLQNFVSQGGALMIFLADNILPDSYNTLLLPRHLMPGPLIKRVVAGEGKSFFFDFNPNSSLHPLLSLFAHQTDTGLETAQAFGYWQADVPDDSQLRVLNWKHPEGSNSPRPDPAITQQTLGQGRVLLITTSANEQWISFTRKPIYAELVNELLSGSVNLSSSWLNLTVGDKLVIPQSCRLLSTPLLKDSKSALIALSLNSSGLYESPELTEPGIYTLSTGTAELPIALNIPPEASDVRTIDNAGIKSALGGIDLSLNGDQPLTPGNESHPAADWGWTLMLLVLLLTCAETFCSRQFGNQRKVV